MGYKAICVEINGVFYESFVFAEKIIRVSRYLIKKRCSSNKWFNYKFVPFRITYTEKKCRKCGKLKVLKEFNKKHDTKDGLSLTCRECARVCNKNNYYNNPEYFKKYLQNNEKRISKYGKEYGARPEVRARRRERGNKRRKNDIMFKLNTNISNSIRNSLKGGKKGKCWEGLVGYTCEELRAHLKKQFLPGMTWENYGRGKGKWHMDHHPIPLYWFVFEKYTDKGFKKAWALENLRPAWGKDNISKGNKLFHP